VETKYDNKFVVVEKRRSFKVVTGMKGVKDIEMTRRYSLREAE
jgi:hypothetical protein